MTTVLGLLRSVILVLLRAGLIGEKLDFFADVLLFLANWVGALVSSFDLFDGFSAYAHTLQSLLQRRRHIVM